MVYLILLDFILFYFTVLYFTLLYYIFLITIFFFDWPSIIFYTSHIIIFVICLVTIQPNLQYHFWTNSRFYNHHFFNM